MSVLIVAFDGLDKELIDEYGCDTVKQTEFGTINNTEGITSIVTSELFASFITGTNWKHHGVIGLKRPYNDYLAKIESLNRSYWFRKFFGIRRAIYQNIPFINGNFRKYDKTDLAVDTFFESIPDSIAIDVPSYNIGYNIDFMPTLSRLGIEAAERDLNRFENCKRSELFEAIEEEHDLVMAHFHKPDHIHHWYWEVGKMDKVEQTYHEMNVFAKEILEQAEGNYDTIIFMSDHGLPDVESGDGHNENAFYSCNHELFPDRTPHITDFHDKILELAGQDEDDETAGIDV